LQLFDEDFPISNGFGEIGYPRKMAEDQKPFMFSLPPNIQC